MRIDKYLASGMTFAEAAEARRKDREANKAAYEAKRAERAASVEYTHCQICERAILAKTGKIAHHGYQRPGHGWQTASCFGARFRPYEVACDALPKAIASLTQYIKNQNAALTHWRAEPPRGIEWYDQRHSYNPRYPRSFLRPINFDRTTPPATYGRDDKYAQLYFGRVAELESCIHYATADVKRLRKRLADWKPANE